MFANKWKWQAARKLIVKNLRVKRAGVKSSHVRCLLTVDTIGLKPKGHQRQEFWRKFMWHFLNSVNVLYCWRKTTPVHACALPFCIFCVYDVIAIGVHSKSGIIKKKTPVWECNLFQDSKHAWFRSLDVSYVLTNVTLLENNASYENTWFSTFISVYNNKLRRQVTCCYLQTIRHLHGSSPLCKGLSWSGCFF